MRTQQEIEDAKTQINNGNYDFKSAMLDVLNNDLDYQEIEDKYYDEQGVWEEQAALSVREWLDGEKQLNEL